MLSKRLSRGACGELPFSHFAERFGHGIGPGDLTNTSTEQQHSCSTDNQAAEFRVKLG
jgi:hypothetical protein